MKTTLASAGNNFIKFDKEIEKEQNEMKKLDGIIAKLKQDVEKNTKMGESLVAELGALDE
jgi:peptidoglycan hydrolase CwlO-like protein